jgi:hypothetical protein
MSQQINLYNPIFLKQRKIFSAATMAQALVVIVAAALAFAAFAHYQVRHLADEVQRGEARLKAEEARFARLSSEFGARTKSAELEADMKRAEAELKGRESVVALLESGALGATLDQGGGVSSYLRALARQTLDGLWLTGFELAGEDMMLTGRALRGDLLPEYLRRLGREQVMQGRQFALLDMREPKPAADQKAGDKAAPRYIEFSLRSAPAKDSKGEVR